MIWGALDGTLGSVTFASRTTCREDALPGQGPFLEVDLVSRKLGWRKSWLLGTRRGVGIVGGERLLKVWPGVGTRKTQGGHLASGSGIEEDIVYRVLKRRV